MGTSPNAHVDQFLEHYAQLPHPPHYAVLLKGPWGAGKTFLIKEALRRVEERTGVKHVYTSLYGIADAEQLERAVFASTYKLLAGKTVRATGKLLSAVMKMGGVETGDLGLKDFLNHDPARLYVFDDLERSSMPLSVSLGFINQFVEHDGLKVVVVANEDEIVAAHEEYRRIKEKLIGRTLAIRADFEAAFAHFLRSVQNTDSREVLEIQAAEIHRVYSAWGLNNLRILQQTMWDFERLFLLIPPEQRTNTSAVQALVQQFFAYSLEFRAGRISLRDLEERTSKYVRAIGARLDSASPKSGLDALEERYPTIEFDNATVSSPVLASFFDRGVIEKEALHSALAKSSYFAKPEDEPEWRTLWYLHEREGDRVEQAIDDLERKFVARQYRVPGEILHVFGLRLRLQQLGWLQKSEEELLSEGKAYIDELLALGALEPFPIHDTWARNGANAHDGLAFACGDTKAFSEFEQYVRAKRDEAEVRQFPARANALMAELRSDARLFLRRVTLTPSSDDESIYFDKPVLAALPADEFARVFLGLAPENQRIVAIALNARYRDGHFATALADELKWLPLVIDRLLKAATLLPRVDRHRVESLVRESMVPYVSGSGAST